MIRPNIPHNIGRLCSLLFTLISRMNPILSFILCVFLATDKEAFLLCFSALTLNLVVLIVTNLEMNICLEIERFLTHRGFQTLVIPIRALNKSLTPAEEKQKQLDCVRSWEDNLKKYEETLQREIYLLDEKEILEEKNRLSGDLNAGERASLARTKMELACIKPRLWIIGQKFSQLRLEGASGSWTLEYSTEPLDKKWKKDRILCDLTLGCCSRGCGCCKKHRRGRGGRREELHLNLSIHCTVACGCCIRWRGFQYLEDMKPENEDGVCSLLSHTQ